MPETKVGVVTHYFGKVGVAVIKATDGDIRVGDTIRIKGHTSDHTQVVESMQVEHQPIAVIAVGKDAGVKVGAHLHEHDVVYKVT
jgi:putative protease